jgi:hypothetical protein
MGECFQMLFRALFRRPQRKRKPVRVLVIRPA